MSETNHVLTIRLPLRRLSAALPAFALITAGIMAPATATPTAASRAGLASKSSPAIVVPSTPITLPNSSLNQDDPRSPRSAKSPVSQPLASILPAGTLAGSSQPVTLDSAGIPLRALQAYRQSATLIGSADPSCHLDWPLLAAIGRVESDHAREGGNQLDAAGVARPGIFGIPLDGSNGTARILDTDRGLLDHDTTFDRAVGPMQFIPGTWRSAGVDANGDGVKDPQNMADAAAATAVYLCSGPGDLSRPADLRSAILRYNPSDSYVSMVIAIADAYRHGVRTLPASDVAPVRLTTAKSRAAAAAVRRTKLTAGKLVAPRPGSTPAKATAAKPEITPQAPATSIPAVTQVPSTTPPGSTQPTPSTTPTSTAPSSTPPTSTTTCVPIPSATSTTSTGTASPRPTTTCLPPCAPTASGTSTATATSSTASPTATQTCLPPCAPTASPASGATSTAPALPCLTPPAGTPSAKTTP